MSVIQIEVTDDNPFNEGWLKYLLGLDRPAVEEDGPGAGAGANGWDMGSDTPEVKRVRHVFTRQNDIDHPQYVVREINIAPMPAPGDGDTDHVTAKPTNKPTRIVIGE